MKKIFIIGMAVISAVALVSCKSSESSYRKAYEKAQQTQTPTVVETTTPAVVETPYHQAQVVEQQAPAATESSTLKTYNVVCGSFQNRDGANTLVATLISKGYKAQILQDAQSGMYRVIAFTSDNKADAVAARDSLRSVYSGAWLLTR